MISLWTIIVERALIALAAGEIAIRYAVWSYMIKRSGERMQAAPLVFGVGIWGAARFLIEFKFLLLMVEPTKASLYKGVFEGDWFSAAIRLALFTALCFLTYPVTKLQYKDAWEKAVVELVVRIFLIGVSAIAGWVCANVYMCHAFNCVS